MAFSDWCVQLAEYFFGHHAADSNVRLMMGRDMLDSSFPHLGGFQGFLSDLNRGPEWVCQTQIAEAGENLYYQWRFPRLRPPNYPNIPDDCPPYLPLLCLLCLAWTENPNEDAGTNAFYSRLDTLAPSHGLNSNRLRRWLKLWSGLESWTNNLGGSRGRFKVERLGGRAYVGIPLSQVVLPPHKLDDLPDLFFRLNFSAEESLSINRLREALIVHDIESIRILGTHVFAAIRELKPLGEFALSLLLEHFEDWDGGNPHYQSPGSRALAETAPRAAVRLLLEPHSSGAWKCTFCLQSESRDGATERDSNLVLRATDGVSVFHELKTNSSLNALQQLGLWATGNEWEFIFDDDVEGDSSFLLKCPSGEIRAFGENWVADRYLLETGYLPSENGSYFLATQQGASRLKAWANNANGRLIETEVPQDGIPQNLAILYYGGLEHLTEEDRSLCPVSTFTQREPRRLRLVGGSRVRSGSARRAYLHYDPPILECDSASEPELRCHGATLHREFTVPSTVRNLPGSNTWRYRIEVEDDRSLIWIEADSATTTERISFGVFRSEPALLEQITFTNFRIDRFGYPSREKGARGCYLDHGTNERFEFQTNGASHGCCNSVSRPQSEASTGTDFIASLHLTGGKALVLQEAKRRAVQIAGADSATTFRELRWLRDLGTIEIKVDQRGFWSHVIPNRPHLGLLPFRANEEYQAALCGCWTPNILNQIRECTEGLGGAVQIDQNECLLVPPRVILRHREIEAFELISGQFEMPWRPIPPAFEFAEWAGSIGDWQEDVGAPWLEGEGPIAAGAYIPGKYRSERGAEFHARMRLDFIEDNLLGGRRIHKVVKHEPDSNWIVKTTHAYVRDPSWAKWQCHYKDADTDLTQIPYDEIRHNLILPKELILPYVLARAIAVSSCRAPRRRSVVYDVPPSSFGADWWVYGDVPKDIAIAVLAKLQAEPYQDFFENYHE
jgi:hypothetical protein